MRTFPFVLLLAGVHPFATLPTRAEAGGLPLDDARRAQDLATAYLQRVPSVSDGTKLRLIREAEREIERCVQLCEQELARDPAAAGVAGQLTACRELRATLAGAPSSPPAVVPQSAPVTTTTPAALPTPVAALPVATTVVPAAPTNPVERLEQAAALFTAASAALDDGMARMKSKDLYASLEADALLARAERDLAQVKTVFGEVLGANPGLKTQPLTDGANRVKAGLMQSSTGIRLERATQKRGQLKLRLGKEQRLWDAALKKNLTGGRLQTFKQRGAPQDFDGNAPDLTPAQRLQQLPTSPTWRYARPGCSVEVRFEGDQVKDTTSQPPGC